MRTISLFDGYSTGLYVLNRVGLPVEQYVSYEIDKYAMQVSRNNWDGIDYRGTVEGADFRRHAGADLLIGGSPCQGFSFAGKQLNFSDPRSKLVFEYVRALDEIKPSYFFLENVLMKQEYQDVISGYLGVQPIFIDSKCVSAQMRKRLYWTNIPGGLDLSDRGKSLSDILQPDDEVDDKWWINRKEPLKPRAVKCVMPLSGKSRALCASPYKGLGNNSEVIIYRPARMIGRRIDENGARRDSDRRIPTKQYIEVGTTDVSPCLTTVEKGSLLTTADPGRHTLESRPPLRRLTCIERERLQGLPDNYTAGVSDTQRIKMLGNGWQSDTIELFFNNLATDLLL